MNPFASQSHRTLLSRPSTSTIASTLAVSVSRAEGGAPNQPQRPSALPPVVVELDGPTPPASGIRSSLAASQETQHPSSPRATANSGPTFPVKSEAHDTAAAAGTVTMQVPAGLVSVVSAFKQAQLQLSEAEHALGQRAEKMLARLASATHSDASQASDDSDAPDQLQGIDLVQHDLGICEKQVHTLRTLSNVFNDTGARRAECELMDHDVAELQASAAAQFQSLIALTQRAISDALGKHQAQVQRSQQMFAEAREAFCAHQQDLGKRMQGIARASMSKLDAMHRRMSLIERQKAVEADEVKGRLSTRDRYDPETVTLHRTSTKLTEHLGLVASQLQRMRELRAEMFDAVGGAAHMEAVVGAEWLANLAAQPPATLSPTDRDAAEPMIAPATTTVVEAPAARLEVHHNVAPPAQHDDVPRPGAIAKRGRSDEVINKGQRAPENGGNATTNPNNATAAANVPRPQQVAEPSKQQQQPTPVIRLTPLHQSNANTQVPPAAKASTQHGEVEAQPEQRKGFMSFFKAIAARAMAFEDDVEIVEQADCDSDTTGSPSGSPERQRRRTERASLTREGAD